MPGPSAGGAKGDQGVGGRGAGAPLRQVDGAVQWNGTHRYEYGLANLADYLPHRRDAPRLLHMVAPMVDSVSVVAASRVTRDGYEVSTRGPDGSWLCGAGRSGTTCGAACPSTA